jgi:hypothetical protein
MVRRSRLHGFAIAVLAATALASCGGGDEESDDADAGGFTGDEVVSAFEEAAGGYPFEEATSLVDGATAYGPKNSADVDEVAPLNDALGQDSILWQVFVFDAADPPLDEEAARAVAFSSSKFEDAGDGVYLGDSDIAYVANGNVVITGPVGAEGGVDDPTLAGWRSVLDGL